MLISPDQNGSAAGSRPEPGCIDALRAAKQTTEFYPLPAEAYLRDATITVAKYARSEPNFLSTN
jgi:hypothetical protein